MIPRLRPSNADRTLSLLGLELLVGHDVDQVGLFGPVEVLDQAGKACASGESRH